MTASSSSAPCCALPAGKAKKTRQRLSRKLKSSAEAMVFDSLDIEYEYEPESFVLAHGEKRIGYLIDFMLPELKRYIEIKYMGSTPPTLDECRKAALLAQQNEHGWPVTIMFSSIGNYINHGSGRTYWPNGDITMSDVLTECPTCGQIDFCTDGKLKHMTCSCKQEFPEERNDQSTKIQSAYKKAKYLDEKIYEKLLKL